jgi:hypothetical protein
MYGGRALYEAERNYSIINLEGLALVSAIQEWSAYLQHQPFIVETDNISLTWLSKINGSSGRLGRWAVLLSPFKFTIKHRSGKSNSACDGLSRKPYIQADKTDTVGKATLDNEFTDKFGLLDCISEVGNNIEVTFEYGSEQTNIDDTGEFNINSIEDIAVAQRDCPELKPMID